MSLEEKLKVLKKHYIASLAQLPAQFRMWHQNKDVEALLFEIHKLKGSGACYGLNILSDWAAGLEQKLSQEGLSSDTDLWISFLEELTQDLSCDYSEVEVNERWRLALDVLTSGSPNKKAA